MAGRKAPPTANLEAHQNHINCKCFFKSLVWLLCASQDWRTPPLSLHQHRVVWLTGSFWTVPPLQGLPVLTLTDVMAVFGQWSRNIMSFPTRTWSSKEWPCTFSCLVNMRAMSKENLRDYREQNTQPAPILYTWTGGHIWLLATLLQQHPNLPWSVTWGPCLSNPPSSPPSFTSLSSFVFWTMCAALLAAPFWLVDPSEAAGAGSTQGSISSTSTRTLGKPHVCECTEPSSVAELRGLIYIVSILICWWCTLSHLQNFLLFCWLATASIQWFKSQS